ncbi:MAG: DUF2860 family protein [Desulfobacterales bacterium]|jgi:hypothetical protein
MKKIFYLSMAASIIVVLVAAGFATALEPIPEETGFSGFIRPGVGYISFKSNMVASFLGFDLSDKRTNALDESPDSQSSAIALVPFSLEYTFAGTRTQLFLGTELTDLIRFDFSQQIGVKQGIGKLGIVQGGFLFNGIPAKVWEDPYVAPNQDRKETDRYYLGGRLVWDRIFGSQLQLQYTYRNIDLDDEKSGEFLGLIRSKRDLLDRNGDRHIGEIFYRFDFAQRHRLTPTVIYTRNSLDGDAMASNAYEFQLTYAYLGDPITFTVNGLFGQEDYDEENPIYNKDQDDDRYGLQATVYYKNPWGWRLFGSKPMNFYISGAYIDIDSNISFYDQQAIMGTGGVMFKW